MSLGLASQATYYRGRVYQFCFSVIHQHIGVCVETKNKTTEIYIWKSRYILNKRLVERHKTFSCAHIAHRLHRREKERERAVREEDGSSAQFHL